MQKLLLIGFVWYSMGLAAQDPVTAWGTLSLVQSTKKYDPEMGYETIDYVMNPMIEKLNGTDIAVDGYIIPLTGQIAQNHFMFSKFPQHMCFFCGKAGPESAMQVFMADDKKLEFTSDKIKIEGTLLINNDQASGLLYTLTSAKLIE